MSMMSCSSCGRHHQVSDTACPFCGTESASASGPARAPLVRKAMHMLGGVSTAVVLAACYGAAPFEDADMDGWGLFDGDCNDDDAAINPDADEICDDGVDNDCNGFTDGDDPDCGGSDTDAGDTDA